MAKAYGALFTNRYGTIDEGIWSTILGDITPEEMRNGFKSLWQNLKKSDCPFRVYPPTPWEFLDLCKPAANEKKFFVAAEHSKNRPLRTAVSDEIGKAAIAEIRKMFIRSKNEKLGST